MGLCHSVAEPPQPWPSWCHRCRIVPVKHPQGGSMEKKMTVTDVEYWLRPRGVTAWLGAPLDKMTWKETAGLSQGRCSAKTPGLKLYLYFSFICFGGDLCEWELLLLLSWQPCAVPGCCLAMGNTLQGPPWAFDWVPWGNNAINGFLWLQKTQYPTAMHSWSKWLAMNFKDAYMSEYSPYLFLSFLSRTFGGQIHTRKPLDRKRHILYWIDTFVEMFYWQ